MRRGPALLAAALLLLATAAAAAPPPTGVVVPGKSFGGLRLGATPAQVKAAWGSRFGRCRDCSTPTWYYNYRDFEPRGVGVSFRRGRAEAFFTLWSPIGWRTPEGLKVGDALARTTLLYGVLPRVECGTYSVFVLRRGGADTHVYTVDYRVWGFGLSRAGAPACR